MKTWHIVFGALVVLFFWPSNRSIFSFNYLRGVTAVWGIHPANKTDGAGGQNPEEISHVLQSQQGYY